MNIQKSRHATHLLHAHLVFVTKYRYNILTKEHIDYMGEIFKETIEEMGGTLQEFDGERNHVHLLIQYPPKHSISLIVNNLKGRSSRLLRRDMPNVKERYWGNGSSLWHRSYFAGSVGGATLEVVKQYIQQQDTPN
ncbi:MAG: IS200/IS605 family transposase [Campylobacterota bacterium]|nr:IS200/IS605 family transposase [Campylobacterota bacterium]